TNGSRRSSSVISATRSCVFAPRIASRATRTTSFPSAAVGATTRQASLRIRPRRTPGGPGTRARRGSGGEARATLAAAARQDRAAGPGPNADAEAVRLRAVTVVRLIGALALGHTWVPLDAKAGSR